MKIKKPVFLISYPSDLKESEYKNLFINSEKEKAELFYTFGHFNEIEIKGKWNNIITFSVSKNCPIVYLIDEDFHIWKYDFINRTSEKINKIVSGTFQNIKDCETTKNLLIIAGENKIQAFSTITWQILWEIKDGIDSNKKPFKPEKETDYKFKPIKVRATNEFIYVYEQYRKRILKFNLGGEFVNVITENTQIIDLAVFNDNIFIIKQTDIPEYLKLPENTTINSADFDNYLHLYIGTNYFDDEQGSIFILDKEKKHVDNLTSYKKEVKKLIIDGKNRLYVLGKIDNKTVLSIFKSEKIYNQNGESIFTFDSTIPDCQWHRLVLDCEIPKGTNLTVILYADDDKNQSIKKIDTKGISFQNPTDIYIPDNFKGQYLSVKLKFQSDFTKKNSPVLNSIKAIFPRKTYLDYLPAFYQENKETKKILERYLSIFQTLNEEIEKEILNTPYLIDPLTTNPEFLNWLSGWLGIIRDENLDTNKWRIFLNNAYSFYKKRGTKEGIKEVLRILLNEEPIIVEPFQIKQCGGQLFEFKNPEQEIDDFTFCIFLKPEKEKSENYFQTVKKIINTWKPAYTEAKVVQLKNMILLGAFTGLGINSYLYEPQPLAGLAVIPFDTVLTDTEENLQIEIHSRLGVDSNLKF